MAEENIEEKIEEGVEKEIGIKRAIKGALNFYDYEIIGKANQGVTHNCWAGRNLHSKYET